MNTTQVVDLAILGGGCAGLSLARELAVNQVKRSVIVIEPRQAYEDDRSWCFWAADQNKFQDWVSFSWTAWSFGQAGELTASQHQPGIRYQYIRSADFYRKSLALIQTCPAIDVHLGQTVTALTPHEQGWEVETDVGIYTARQVLDTRPPAQARIDHSTLLQCFLGVEIELEQAAYADARQLELMTDMRVTNGDFCFTYILPYTRTHLMVEVTFFAKERVALDTLQRELDQLLKRRGWSEARIIRQEHGALPMGLPKEVPSSSNQPPQAGMRAGALRPSSGYAFMRIQRWAQRCAQQYVTNGQLHAQTGSGFWLQKMDQLFLDVIKKEPKLAPLMFNALLGQLSPARFIRFMDDQATLSDCLHVIRCMPKTAFLKTLFFR